MKHIKALESTELGSIWTRIVLGWNGTQKDREKKKSARRVKRKRDSKLRRG